MGFVQVLAGIVHSGIVNKPPISTKQSSTDAPLTLPDVSSSGTDKLRNYGKVSAENQLEHALSQEEAPDANISDALSSMILILQQKLGCSIICRGLDH
ncbi:hypothetical protein SAY86_005840 [Trapa natans]|uniref:Uncharacterized protein n=1 Tax=Trapa natans TaxID=22666 RepID=A0AAN7QSW1_TRANT|nr:hypothetical protein SAY86_005840 [Trapa natans]